LYNDILIVIIFQTISKLHI